MLIEKVVLELVLTLVRALVRCLFGRLFEQDIAQAYVSQNCLCKLVRPERFSNFRLVLLVRDFFCIVFFLFDIVINP